MTEPYIARRYRNGRLKNLTPFPVDADGVPLGFKKSNVIPRLPKLRSLAGFKPPVNKWRIKHRLAQAERTASK